MRINGNKPKGTNTMREKKTVTKKLRVAPPGFEPAPQLPLAQKLRNLSSKINSLKGAVSRNSAILGNYKIPVNLRET